MFRRSALVGHVWRGSGYSPLLTCTSLDARAECVTREGDVMIVGLIGTRRERVAGDEREDDATGDDARDKEERCHNYHPFMQAETFSKCFQLRV